MSAPPNSSPCTSMPVVDTSASTTWRSIARSTSVAKSLPFFCTAESAPWPETNGFAASSRIAAAWETKASRSVSSSAIAGYSPTAASACGSVNRPAYSAFPMIAPSTPLPVSVAMARRSSRLDTPPDAITGASVRSATLDEQLEVGPGQRAVLGDVGDDEPRASLLVKAFQHRPQVAAVGLPAASAQPVLAVDDLHVQPHGHLVAVLGDDAGTPFGILQRRSAQIDPARSRSPARLPATRRRGFRRTFPRRHRACRPPRRAVRGSSRDRTRRPGRPGGSIRRRRAATSWRRPVRIRTPSRFPPVPAQAAPPCRQRHRRQAGGSVAFLQARRSTLDQSPSTQLANSVAPASPLFSGWNWVAASAPSSTAARNGT